MKLFVVLIVFALFAGCIGSQENGFEMSIEEALEIAWSSDCAIEGNMTGQGFYNNNTQTWWLETDIVMAGCAPACVVSADDGSAGINWRCTGLLPE